MSPLFSISTCTPSPTSSINSQLSPCSMKENYDPSENSFEHVSCQERALRLSEKSHNYPKTDMTIQLNIIPIQLHEDISPRKILYQSKTHSMGMKRKKRTSNHKLRNKMQDSNLSVIERHKKLGDGALDKLKSEVQAFAADHTYKETARKFGIHHSTVSGWIKQSLSQPLSKVNAYGKNDFCTSCKKESCVSFNPSSINASKNKIDLKNKIETDASACKCKKSEIESNVEKNKKIENKVRKNLFP